MKLFDLNKKEELVEWGIGTEDSIILNNVLTIYINFNECF
jgi:hypothetical protein